MDTPKGGREIMKDEYKGVVAVFKKVKYTIEDNELKCVLIDEKGEEVDILDIDSVELSADGRLAYLDSYIIPLYFDLKDKEKVIDISEFHYSSKWNE